MLAKTCIYLDRRKEALQLLGEEYQNHRGPFLIIRQSPELLTLKDEPRYKELLAKIHLPAPSATTQD